MPIKPVNATRQAPVTALPPAQPKITKAIAFDLSTSDATFSFDDHTAPSTPKKDPLYIEIDQFEIGVKYELINLSANPDAGFGADEEKVILSREGASDVAPSGSFINKRTNDRALGFYISAEQMASLDLQAGDQFALRAVDKEGNASVPSRGSFEPTSWSTGVVSDSFGSSRGARLRILSGASEDRKGLIIKVAQDSRPPMILEEGVQLSTNRHTKTQKSVASELMKFQKEISKHWGVRGLSREDAKEASLDERLPLPARKALKRLANKSVFRGLDTQHSESTPNLRDDFASWSSLKAVAEGLDEGEVFLLMDRAMEPNSAVLVKNLRTGTSKRVLVDGEGKMATKLAELSKGDVLEITPEDNSGSLGKALQIRYAPREPMGKAKPLTGSNIRFT